jgi:hypothetical protein
MLNWIIWHIIQKLIKTDLLVSDIPSVISMSKIINPMLKCYNACLIIVIIQGTGLVNLWFMK